MKLNRLLERQLKKFFPGGYRDNKDFESFLNAVNNSYNAYERDKELSANAFKVSEEEYREVNNKLKDEVNQREISITTLREVLTQVNDTIPAGLEDDTLQNIAGYLKSELVKRSEVESLLTQQKQFYEHILNNMPADIAVFDKDHKYLFLNPVAIKNPELRMWMIGKDDEEYCRYRNKPLSIAHERRKLFNETVESRNQKEWEEKLQLPDGSYAYHLRKMFPVFDATGDLDIVIGYGIDITERKNIEEHVKLSEKRYKEIFDHSQALICTHDLNGTVLAVNNAAVQTFEYSADELVGSPVSSILVDNVRKEFDKSYLQKIKEDGVASGVMIANSKYGQKIYLLYQNFLVHEEGAEPYVIGFSQDITARINAEKALKKSEEKYRNIIANMNLGLMEVDKDEIIIYANNSFCEMSGYDQEELVGKKASEVFIKGDNKDVLAETILKRREGISDAYELSVKHKSGDIRWWLISGAPNINDNGEFKGSIGIHLDISQQKLLEMELRNAKAEAERSAQAKETFLANMSHEIRTPMNAIMGLGKLLQKTKLEKQQQFYLNSIQGAADNLLVIINDILDFSKIEAGKIHLENIGFQPRLIVDNAMAVLKHKAEEKGLALVSNTDHRLANVLIGDPYRINQVLMNLLGNSLKFTEKGEISIDWKLLEDTDAIQTSCITIADTGKGMSHDFMLNLFDKFTQEDATVTRKFGGTGLGMSISKQLVELMGGKITVSSELDKGTVIRIMFSFKKGTIEDLPEKNSRQLDTQVLREKKILLVEDNEMNRLVATTMLDQYGAEITEAENGLIAIEKLKTHSFDLILMDMQMPELDGLETTEHIRKHIDTSIPIIALTANAIKGEEEKCLSAGMNDFISKPFEEQTLLQVVALWLGRDAHIKKTSQQDNKEQAILYSLDKIVEISRGNTTFVSRMLELFIKEIPATLEQMQDAVAHKDWPRVASLAHRIKPTLANMSIGSVKQDILYLEECKQQDTSAISEVFNRVKVILDTIVADIIKKHITQ